MTPEQLLRFHEACHIVLAGRKPEQGIGTLGEKSLHAVLKYYYQPDESQHERKIGRMTADAILPNGSILEIQTRSFYSLRKNFPYSLPMDRFIWSRQSYRKNGCAGYTRKPGKSFPKGFPQNTILPLTFHGSWDISGNSCCILS